MTARQDAYTLVGKTAESKQFTLLKDGFHAKHANFGFAWAPEMVHTLKAKGVKHFFTEHDRSRQPLIDAYMRGEYASPEQREALIQQFAAAITQETPEQQRKTGEAFVAFLDECKKEGIQVHAASATEKFGHLDNFLLRVEKGIPLSNFGPADIQRWYAEKPGFDKVAATGMVPLEYFTVADMKRWAADSAKLAGQPEETRIQCIQALTALNQMTTEGAARTPHITDNTPLTKQTLGYFEQRMVEERSNFDKELAGFIKEKAGDDKAAVLFGAGHGQLENDLDELLGNDKVGKVLLTPSQNTLNRYLATSGYQELPSAIIFTEYDEKGSIVPVMALALGIAKEVPRADVPKTEYSLFELPAPSTPPPAKPDGPPAPQR
jgi:hypothetical protein